MSQPELKSVTELVDLILKGPGALKKSGTNWAEVIQWTAEMQSEILRHRVGLVWTTPAPGGELLEVLFQDLERTKQAAEGLLQHQCSLDTLMKTAGSAAEALAKGPMTLAEALSGIS
jgi:hypothetical protein